MSVGDVLIDYENIPQQANNVRNVANQINDRLIIAYNKIAKMHDYWYGKRYNELVTKFNNLVPQLNQFLEVILSDIPQILDSVANNFSEIDIGQNVANTQKSEIKTLQEIHLIEDIGMRYLDSEVANIEAEIVGELQSAKELMQELEKSTVQIVMECDGANEFKNQLNKLSLSFGQTMDNIERQFTSLMAEDRKQIQNAETSNTVN